MSGYHEDCDLGDDGGPCDHCLEMRRLRQALARIAEQQQKTLRWLEDSGVVFDGPLGNDPENWQHVAFSIYTDLCEVDTVARTALAAN